MRRFPFVFCVLSLSLATVAGCGDNHQGRVAISGKVSLKDQPLKSGVVIFEPLDKQDTGAMANLANGTYSIPAANGLKAGRYLVRITAGDGKNLESTGMPGPGGSNIVSKDLVPAEWNRLSKEERTVEAGKANTFDFDIK